MRPARRPVPASILSFAILLTAACGPGAQDDAEHRDGPVVSHAMGETRVPDSPQRVVVLDTGELDAALALGVKPVGMVLADTQNGLPEYLDAEDTDGIEPVGTIGSPNLEKIAALEPDLILSSKVRDAERYELLDSIAPTIFAETVGTTWKENFRLNAQALGKTDEARRVLGEYDQHTDEIGNLVDDPESQQVSALRATGEDFRIYGEGSFIGTILDDAGLGRPENQRTEDTFREISREQISAADGDMLFYSTYGDQGEEELNAVRDSVQWTNLEAVRQDRAIAVPDDTWFLGMGPIGAEHVLDDLQEAVSQD